MKKIRVIGKISLSAKQRDRLIKIGTEYIADNNPHPSDKKEILSRVDDAHIILNNISTPLTRDILQKCPNLEFIQTWSTGVDNIDVEYAKTNGIRVANVADFSTSAVAEKTIGLMILAANKLIDAHRHAVSGNWDYQRFIGRELNGKNLCLVGYGRIAKKVEHLAKSFGMNINFINSKTPDDRTNEYFAEADFISVHCPLNSSTYHLISKEKFRLMNGVIFINNSRGGVVDEDALFDALESGNVNYATLDVFEKEPPCQNNRLLKHPRAFVTPHCTWNTEESLEKLTDTAINNIELFIHGKMINFIV